MSTELEAVESVLIEHDEDYGSDDEREPNGHLSPATCVKRLIVERDALKKQVDDLQAANTRLLEERRAVDTHYMVEHFHRVLDIPVLTEPQVPADERVRLRVTLITEEYFELMEATFAGTEGPNVFDELRGRVLVAIEDEWVDIDVPEFADACADLKYVIVGSELEFGFDGRPVFKGVHEANMRKVGGPKREDGKVQKPDGWQPFDVGAELKRQGWRGR